VSLRPLRLPGGVGLGDHVPRPEEQPEPGPLGRPPAGGVFVIIFLRVFVREAPGGRGRGVARGAAEGEELAEREAAGDGCEGRRERGGGGEGEYGGRRAHRGSAWPVTGGGGEGERSGLVGGLVVSE
jgi:hypothetical protein